MAEANKTERRKNRRLRIPQTAFACLGGRSTVLGQIMDIGMGGLAFHYSGSRERTRVKSLVQILTADCSFTSDKLPIKTVWDTAIPLQYSFAPLPVRRCGVRFKRLTASQRSNLKHFIKKHTTSSPEV